MGTILINLLLVQGAAFIFGGSQYMEGVISASAAQVNSYLLALAVIAILLPAAFHFTLNSGISDEAQTSAILKMSHGVAVILLVTFVFYIMFRFKTHRFLFDMEPIEESDEGPEEGVSNLPIYISVILLVVTIGLLVVTLEWLIESIDDLTVNGQISKEWIGLILIPVLSGNTIERIESIVQATRAKIYLAIESTVGSSIEIALLIIPLVICVAWGTGKPLSFLFDPYECIILFLSVLMLNYLMNN
ncbi:hypothetical protein SERLA73DRAFT_187449, partial [Serpula lacrymans var. lacrymans S7.3]